MTLPPWDESDAWDAYVRWWREGLRVLLGWPESLIEAWCLDVKHKQLSLPKGMVFFNFPPEARLAEAFIPDWRGFRERGIDPVGLRKALRVALAKGFADDDAERTGGTDYDWESARGAD